MIKCKCCGAKLSREDDEHICDKRYYEKLRELADLKAKCDAMERMLGAANYIEGEIDSREFAFKTIKGGKWTQIIPYPDDLEWNSPVQVFNAVAAMDTQEVDDGA